MSKPIIFLNVAWFTALCIIIRWVSILMPQIMGWELKAMTHNLVNTSLATKLVNHCKRGEIFFLMQLGKNLDPYLFANLCTELDKSLTSRNEQISYDHPPNETPPADSLYPILTSPNAAEKEAEAAASAAAAVEAAVEAAAERIELQVMNASKVD